MEDKNLTPEENQNTPENAEAKGGLLEFFKKKKGLTIAIAAAVVLLVCALAIVLVKAFGVDTSVATPDEAPTEPTTVEATVPATTEVQGLEDTTWPDGSAYEEKQDWAALKKINTDIKGWITFKNSVINYPVLKSEEDGVGYQYYIHRAYDKSDDYAGSIFIDYRSSKGVKSKNILTHGHSQGDGTMFMSLIDYGKWEPDMDYYKKNPTFFFNTPEGNEQWIIFAVVKTNTLEAHGDFFNYLMGDFDSEAQFMNYIYNMKIRSILDVPVPVNEKDDIITLSTCSYEFDEFRTVVCARKIRNNEKVTDYIKNAKPAEDPVWPDVYYNNFGGERPEITSFQTELKKNNINWYDGKGDLEGSEWLKLTAGSQSFTVTYVNYDGSVISTQTVPRGGTAIEPEDPVKPDSNGYTYIFKGWQYDPYDIRYNMMNAPIFEPVYVGE